MFLQLVFKLYPLLGYSLDFVKQEEIHDGDITIESDSDTDGGIQLGLGLQAIFGSNWFVKGEYRYQPGIFGDANTALVGVGYRF